MSDLPFDQLRSRLCGPLITPADADYETSREIWNRLYDRRPRAVVRCESVSDVIAAVRFAREYDLEIAVKGGGHHAAGYASTDGGILLNLSGMCTVTGELPSVTTSGRAVMMDMVTSLLQSVAPGAVPAAHPHAPVVRDALRADCSLTSSLR